MKVEHVFGGHIYLLTSYGVARNPIFKDEEDLKFFKANIGKYLSEICEIYAYSHQINQFQYLVRIKERSKLEDFFYRKKANKLGGKNDISHSLYAFEAELPPESYLIFSQEVSNCLNSYAKKFNARHGRRGGLFADRYSKYLVETTDEMTEWIACLNQKEGLISFRKEWQYEDEVILSDGEGECSSEVYYDRERGEVHGVFKNFQRWSKDYLRGIFDCLPPRHINAPDFAQKFNFYKQMKGLPPPW